MLMGSQPGIEFCTRTRGGEGQGGRAGAPARASVHAHGTSAKAHRPGAERPAGWGTHAGAVDQDLPGHEMRLRHILRLRRHHVRGQDADQHDGSQIAVFFFWNPPKNGVRAGTRVALTARTQLGSNRVEFRPLQYTAVNFRTGIQRGGGGGETHAGGRVQRWGTRPQRPRIRRRRATTRCRRAPSVFPVGLPRGGR